MLQLLSLHYNFLLFILSTLAWRTTVENGFPLVLCYPCRCHTASTCTFVILLQHFILSKLILENNVICITDVFFLSMILGWNTQVAYFVKYPLQLAGEWGRSTLLLFENWKKYLDFGKKSSDCLHLWLTFLV